MNKVLQDALQRAIETVKGQSQKQVPAVLQPIRDVSNQAGSYINSELSPMNTPRQFGDIDNSEKVQRLIQFALAKAGQGAVQGGGNLLANSLSVSPPGQLAAYTTGMPDPKKQAVHSIDAILGALTLAGGIRPFTPNPFQSALRPGAENAKFVSDLLGIQ